MRAELETIKGNNITFKEVAFNFFMPIGKLPANSLIKRNFIKDGNKRTIKYGSVKVEIRNRLLTLTHHEIVSAIIQFGTLEVSPDGQIISYYREKEILEALNMGNNYEHLREMIKNIADAQYYVKVGKITRRISIFAQHALNTENKLQAVMFDRAYVSMKMLDFSIDYKKVFNKVTDLKKYSYTLPSIVRYLMFQNTEESPKQFHLVSILEAIGFPLDSPNSFKSIKRSLKETKEHLKKEFNIDYDEKKKTLTYSKMKNIDYIKPPKNIDNLIKQYIHQVILFENEEHTIKEIICKNDSFLINTNWSIITDKTEIVQCCFLDDLIFFINQMKIDKKFKGQDYFLLK